MLEIEIYEELLRLLLKVGSAGWEAGKEVFVVWEVGFGGVW